MVYDKSLASDVINMYKDMRLKHGLTPGEFIVLNGLIAASTEHYTKKAKPVTISAVSIITQLSRETVRRLIHLLHKKGLAKKEEELWIFVE